MTVANDVRALRQRMNYLSERKRLSLLEDRICEAEAKIALTKKQLAALGSQGINTGQVCRRSAATTDDLHLLKLRQKLFFLCCMGVTTKAINGVRQAAARRRVFPLASLHRLAKDAGNTTPMASHLGAERKGT